MDINTTHNINALDGAKMLPDKSINCCVTSPPYYGLRDYGVWGQIGLEETPEQYINKLVLVFREIHRALKDDGTLWVNIGDSYAGSGKGAATYPENAKKYKQGTNKGTLSKATSFNTVKGDVKTKDLIGIPWMLAFALRADGWYLRQDIIWSKPNPMPESVTDRCTKAHEYIFLFSKSPRYYFDYEAIKQPARESTLARISQDIDSQHGSDRVPGKTNGRMKAVIGGRKRELINKTLDKDDPMYRHNTYRGYEYTGMAHKRSVWNVATKPFKGAHFAVYPEELIIDCIKAGCPEGGLVLDPFIGSGTTGIVARKLNRNYIGFEINSQYIEIANKRIHNAIGLFQ